MRRKEGAIVMTPDEVIDELKKNGISLSRRTLLRYEEMHLIPRAERGGLGRGKGRVTNYPPHTVSEAYTAANLLLANITREQIALARKEAIDLVENFFTVKIHSVIDDMSMDEILDTEIIYSVIDRITYLWLMIKTKFEYNADFEESSHIEYTGFCDKKELINTRVLPLKEAAQSPYYCMEKDGAIIFNDRDTAISFRYVLPSFMPNAIKAR